MKKSKIWKKLLHLWDVPTISIFSPELNFTVKLCAEKHGAFYMKQIKAVQEKTNKTEKSDKADKTEDNCGIISSCVIQNDFEL